MVHKREAPIIQEFVVDEHMEFNFSERYFGGNTANYIKVKVPSSVVNDYPDFDELEVSIVVQGDEETFLDRVPAGGTATIIYPVDTLKLKPLDSDGHATKTKIQLKAAPETVTARIVGQTGISLEPNITIEGEEASSRQTAIDRSAEGLDETSEQSIQLDTSGRPFIEVYANADTATNFYLDVKTDSSSWVNGYETYSSVTSVKEGYQNAFRYLRLRSDSAGGAGDEVTLILTATR